jgi:hypothetical protein
MRRLVKKSGFGDWRSRPHLFTRVLYSEKVSHSLSAGIPHLPQTRAGAYLPHVSLTAPLAAAVVQWSVMYCDQPSLP